jgi:hypothetical protein
MILRDPRPATSESSPTPPSFTAPLRGAARTAKSAPCPDLRPPRPLDTHADEPPKARPHADETAPEALGTRTRVHLSISDRCRGGGCSGPHMVFLLPPPPDVAGPVHPAPPSFSDSSPHPWFSPPACPHLATPPYPPRALNHPTSFPGAVCHQSALRRMVRTHPRLCRA